MVSAVPARQVWAVPSRARLTWPLAAPGGAARVGVGGADLAAPGGAVGAGGVRQGGRSGGGGGSHAQAHGALVRSWRGGVPVPPGDRCPGGGMRMNGPSPSRTMRQPLL